MPTPRPARLSLPLCEGSAPGTRACGPRAHPAPDAPGESLKGERPYAWLWLERRTVAVHQKNVPLTEHVTGTGSAAI